MKSNNLFAWIISMYRKSGIFLQLSGLCVSWLFCTTEAMASSGETTKPPPTMPSSPTLVVTASPSAKIKDNENNHSYTVDTTSTALGLSLAPKDTPQTVSAITRQQIDDLQADSLKDSLRWSIGVNESAYDTDRSAFGYRGFKVDIYQYDGVPTFIDTSDKTAMDAIILDRIEIVRGAAGLLNGEGNPGAVINIIRKKATAYHPFARINLSAGSWNNYRISVDSGGELNNNGTLRGRIAGALQRSNSFMDRYQQRKAVIYGTLDWDISENTLLRAGIDYQQNRPHSSTWGGALPVGWFSDGSEISWPVHFNGTPDWTRWNSDTNSQFITLEHEFNNGWKGIANYAHARYSYDARMSLSILGNIDRQSWYVKDATLTPGWYTGYSDQHTLDLKLNGDFNLFQREHKFAFGSSAGWRKNYADEREPTDNLPVYNGNILHWNGHIAQPQWPHQRAIADDFRTRQLAIYASTDLSLLDRWDVILGARYNHFSNSDAGQSGKLTPFIGTVVKLTPSLSAYASYTNIFKSQNERDKNGNFLSPIEGINREVGLKSAFFDNRLNISLSGFYITQQHVAIKDADSPSSPHETYHESDGATSKGVEFEVNGQLAEGWNMLFGVTHYSGKDLNTEWPRTNITLFTSYQLPRLLNKLTVAGGARWHSRSYTFVDWQEGQRQAEQRPYWLVDVMMRYNFTQRTRIQMNMSNLLNKKYYSDIDDGTRQYGTPRNFMLMLSHEF